jgi:DNA helicase-2/ATP-dependent DNA helicase PcrA
MRRNQESAAADRQDLSFGDVAILYRLHALAGPLEEALSREGIPYQRFGERAWRGRQDLEGLFSVLSWMVDPNRDEDLLTALATPSMGLGETTLNAVRAMRQFNAAPLWEDISRVSFLERLDPPEATRLRRLAGSLEGLLGESRRAPVSRILARVLAVLRMSRPKTSLSWDPRAEALKSFVAAAEGWQGDLASFLDLWDLQEAADLYDPRAERVALLTVHAAKGLEFSVVFLVGCEEGLFPMTSERADVDEERRLFYVAMTRARDMLYATRAKSRSVLGQRQDRTPSRFLLGIPIELMEIRGESAQEPRPKPPRQLKLF